ncbi:cyclin-like protein [Crucibulum laeve]|uniref:Cyclin-like protein n=1 Tax=Crucibulum laeve TaxID=68775 RepID=A0A5C3MA93_9AGAR|nr:cyclin-like protein [Crucibulum laeve]
MSSSIPLRRTARAIRATKDNENANARPSRVTRTKTTGIAATAQPAVTLRSTTATAASKAKAVNVEEIVAGKRKREVLVEVTKQVTNNKAKPPSSSGTAKGKEKEVPTVEVAKLKTTTTTTTKTARTLTRTTTGATARRITRAPSVSRHVTEEPIIENTAKKEKDPNAMSIDRPRVFIRAESTSHAVREEVVKEEEELEQETHRVFKKRHMEIPLPVVEEHVQDESQLDADKVAADLIEAEAEMSAQAKAEIEDAKPKLWDDLDAEDWDDPVMVSEYVGDICEYWKKIEVTTMPNPEYMKFQGELTWEHRGVLVDWILQVHAKFGLLAESLFLCINILDRFLSARPISLTKLQLVGLTCFFIATKFEETYAPAVAEIAFLSDDQYTVEDILKAERYVLRTIEWDLRAPGPMGWLRRGSKADDCEVQARTVAKYLLEIGLVEWKLIGTLPSLIAATGLWLARLALGREEWTANLAHYSTFEEHELLPTAKIMLEYILLDPITHQSLYKKYSQKRYLRCSVYMRQWALAQWCENDTVDLEGRLSSIKKDIKRLKDAEALKAEEE